MRLGNGSLLELKVDPAELRQSAHAALDCADCHFGYSADGHAKRRFADRRSVTLVQSETCRRCHYDKYTKMLESIHYTQLSRGDARAPVCVDCHSAHRVQHASGEKRASAERCRSCHAEVSRAYSASVHGKGLAGGASADVPVCADCHTAHSIGDPRTLDFRRTIPQICGDCHGNKAVMSRYGLSTGVVRSYLADFHGKTLSFYRRQPDRARDIAVCTDCHGIHDIESVRAVDSQALRARLLDRCRKCHPGAMGDFPSAWMSHYDLSLKRAPLVFAIRWFYRLFIPFMIAGLVLQILLHVWRYAANR